MQSIMSGDRPATILIAEDDEPFAVELRECLADLGYTVLDAVTSSEEVLRAVDLQRPDLVLMDIGLYGAEDGVDVAMRLRKLHQVPVVFLTGYSDPDTLGRARLAEPYGYLVKPIELGELRRTVEIALYKHKMDTRLRERERWFSTTLHCIGDGALCTDPEGRVTFVNAVAEALTGWPEREALGRPLAEVLQFFDAQTGSPLEDPALRALRERRPVTLAGGALLRDRAGVERAVDDSAAPIVGEDGEVLGAVVVFRDVTERQRLQRNIEHLDRLSSLGTLAAGVAHEINNPLAYVITNLYLARSGLRAQSSGGESVEDKEIQKAIGLAEEGAHRIGKIVASLRNFVPTEAPTGAHADLRVALNWAIQVTAHELRTVARLVTEITEVPEVVGDESRLGQVFVNLLINAMQAIGPGRPNENEVRIETALDGQNHVLVRIGDTGSGIKPGDLPRVFDPFFTTKPVGKGTGLGLSVCHGIVAALGGSISVQSSVGKGSVFTVTLPRALDLRPTLSSSPPTPENPCQRRAKVLVIDDEPAIANSIAALLLPEHDVSVYTVPEAALARITAGARYDLILCDLTMPGMTGMDIYAKVVALDAAQAQRMLFLSGGAFSRRAEDFLRAMPDRLISKPFDARALRQIVREFIADPRAPEGLQGVGDLVACSAHPRVS